MVSTAIKRRAISIASTKLTPGTEHVNRCGVFPAYSFRAHDNRRGGRESVKPKQLIREARESVLETIAVVEKMTENFHTQFHEIFPPDPTPISYRLPGKGRWMMGKSSKLGQLAKLENALLTTFMCWFASIAQAMPTRSYLACRRPRL